MPQPEIALIFNPTAGKHRAAERLEALRKKWGEHIAFMPTSAAGHALELAKQAALDGFRVVAAAGGDGTVHEVANGLLLAQRPDVQFAVVPIGSANDFDHSLQWHHQTRPADIHTIDVGIVREPGGKAKYFLCNLGLGFNGAVTLESRKIHRLQGIALYGLATLRALWHHYRCPEMEVTIDQEPMVRQPTLMFSVLLGRREGGFVLAPNAKLDDGLFDFVHTLDLSRFGVLWFLPRLAVWGPPSQHPKLRTGQCKRVAIRSPEPLTIHVDGEFFARPEDKIRQITIEIVPAALKVRCNLDGEPGA